MQQLLTYLDELSIDYQLYRHPAVFTVEQARAYCQHIPGAHCKNLFLRSRKKAYWLVSLLNDAELSLAALEESLNARKFSFASAERLQELLAVNPGSVTPFALINDTERLVNIALDQRFMTYNLVTFHPLVNTATVALSPEDLLRFLESLGYQPKLI